MDCTVHKLVANVTLLEEEHVLFVRYRDRSRYDGQTGWFLPGDYLAQLEHPNDAAARILAEQAGIEGAALDLGDVESFNGHAWHLVFRYVTRVAEAVPIEARGNVAEARWFPLAELPSESDVAHHGWGLETLGRILN
jgi:ADP-ribose pyrophosphatase YjhB (NUDIX family)